MMEIYNGVRYDSNYARAAAAFLGTLGPRPQQPARQAAFDLIEGIYRLIAGQPEKLGLKPSPDIWFGPWEPQKERQKDVKTIHTTLDKVEQLVKELYDLTVAGEVNESGLKLPDGLKPKRTLANALTAQGCTFENGQLHLPQNCAAGLKELAAVSDAHVIPITDSPLENKAHFYFSHCVFEPESDWLIKDFDRLLRANGQLIWLCRELEKRGYQRLDCRDGKRVSLDYIRQIGKKSTPVKISWSDKTHAGIEVSYEDLRLEPCFVWLRMPSFQTVLEKAGELPADVRAFLSRNIKNCDGCRYCVQTDKTGNRPLAAMALGTDMKCPYFPSFALNWRGLDQTLAEQMLAVTDAIEQIL